MICQMCGQREGTVHLLEIVNGQRKSIWLCSICAAGQAEMSLTDLSGAAQGESSEPTGEPASLASFLGQVTDEDGQAGQMTACPGCGYEIKTFRETNRLGCSRCYDHFRAQVQPILARYHRHASHLGKVPQQAGGAASQQGEITRLRVALEKAIQSENYEEAARLRDVMRSLGGERDDPTDSAKRQDPS